MWILQFADLHFSPTRRLTMQKDELLRLINKALLKYVDTSSKIIVCICGDIIFKGNTSGYDLAKIFVEELKEKLSFDLLFYACPGNHDIVDGDDDFNKFNQFSYKISGPKGPLYSRTNTLYSVIVDDFKLIMANSSYHRDIEYGLIKIEEMEKKLNESSEYNVIIVVHHHSIPVEKSDKSTLRNAYEFLKLASEHDSLAILHGHRHMAHCLAIGKKNTALIGVGSPFYLDRPNVNNQFNLLNFNSTGVNSGVSFRFMPDKDDSGRLGDLAESPIIMI